MLGSTSAIQTNSVINVVNGIFINCDERHWDGVKAGFADSVVLDYTSMAGGQPTILTPQQLVDAWRTILPGFEHTHHQIGNYVVEDKGDTATVFCYGTATHYLPNVRASMYGRSLAPMTSILPGRIRAGKWMQ